MSKRFRRGQLFRRKYNGLMVQLVKRNKDGWTTRRVGNNKDEIHTVNEWVLSRYWEPVEEI